MFSDKAMHINTTIEQNNKIAYSVRELSNLVGVCERKIHYEIAMGKLKTSRIGRRVLIRSEEIERWLKDAEV
jgi:excisionase family DNA binding protein